MVFSLTLYSGLISDQYYPRPMRAGRANADVRSGFGLQLGTLNYLLQCTRYQQGLCSAAAYCLDSSWSCEVDAIPQSLSRAGGD